MEMGKEERREGKETVKGKSKSSEKRKRRRMQGDGRKAAEKGKSGREGIWLGEAE